MSTTTHVEGNGARGGGKSLLSGTRVLIISLAVVALLVAMTAVASAERGTGNEIVGTWVVDVAETDGGVPGFQSLLTFHEGGTLTEVSSELGLGLQGLGHGGWTRQGQDYAATFQVWLFNPDTGVAEGRIQEAVGAALGHPVGREACQVDDLIKLEMHRAELRTDHVPVRLLAEKRQIDEVDQRRLERLFFKDARCRLLERARWCSGIPFRSCRQWLGQFTVARFGLGGLQFRDQRACLFRV